MSTLLTLFIISRNGGLMYSQHFSEDAQPRRSDPLLRVASTFHSLHAISAQVAPSKESAIKELEAHTFKLICFETMTGVKFFATVRLDCDSKAIHEFLQGVYEIYSDYVMKNPFQELDNVIKNPLVEERITMFARRSKLSR